MTESPSLSLSDLIKPHERQREFLSALRDHQFPLYGGAAGGGKSYILRWALIALLIRWAGGGHTGVHVGLFSLDYPTLHDRQLSKIRREMPDWLGDFSEKNREFILKPEYGGGVVAFRNLDDPSKYKSAEFAAIAVEELTEHEESVFDDLRWRLRWPGIEDTKFLAATNPTGIGMHWVKRLWVERDFPTHLKPYAHQFIYVPAKSTDNPHNAASYMDVLRSLPTDMRAALMDGSWDVFAGQMFGGFRRDIHACQPFPIPSWWSVWGSNDPGFNDPGCWYIHAADEDGNVYIADELTFDTRVPYSQQAKVTQARCDELKLNPAYWVTGMDAFNKHPETGKAIVDYYREGGLTAGLRKPVHGPGARAQMAATFHEYLKLRDSTTGAPTAKLRIFDNCKKLISTLPTLPRDENKPEQVAECAIDHWYQAAGYGLQSRHTPQSLAEPPKAFDRGTLGDLAGHNQTFKPKTKHNDPFGRR